MNRKDAEKEKNQPQRHRGAEEEKAKHQNSGKAQQVGSTTGCFAVFLFRRSVFILCASVPLWLIFSFPGVSVSSRFIIFVF
ncbi:MAG: hypothetical protein ACYC26_06410 [Phycisphaerales bacterium]